jgi:hypothetical protein
MNACLYCHPFGRLRAGSEQSEGSGLRMKSFLYGPDSSLHYAPLRMTLSHSVRRSKAFRIKFRIFLGPSFSTVAVSWALVDAADVPVQKVHIYAAFR